MANRNFKKPFAGIEAEMKYPGALARGAKSKDARRIQEWLVYHGHTVAVDDDFGRGTEAALARYQGSLGFTSSGVLDQRTWESLTDPLHRIMAPIVSNGDVRATVLDYAWRNERVKPIEIGGPNAGPFVRSYMLGNDGHWAQWCAGFTCFVLAQAFRACGINELPFVPSFGVPQIARSAQKRGIFSADGPARAGDVFVIPTAKGSWSHIGIVAEWKTPKFVSIEGNTNDAGSADGTCARSWDRTVSRCDYIRIAA